MSIFSNISSRFEPGIFDFFGEKATIQPPKKPPINVTLIRESNNQNFGDDGSLLTGRRVIFYFRIAETNTPANCKVVLNCEEYLTEGEVYRDEDVIAVAARKL